MSLSTTIKSIFCIFLLILPIIFMQTIDAQPPIIEWHEGFGTNLGDHVHEGWQTSDKGFIGIGQNGETTGGCIGECQNILVVKADSVANQECIIELGVEDHKIIVSQSSILQLNHIMRNRLNSLLGFVDIVINNKELGDTDRILYLNLIQAISSELYMNLDMYLSISNDTLENTYYTKTAIIIWSFFTYKRLFFATEFFS